MKRFLIALAFLPLLAVIPARAQQEQQQAMQQAMAPSPTIRPSVSAIWTTD